MSRRRERPCTGWSLLALPTSSRSSTSWFLILLLFFFLLLVSAQTETSNSRSSDDGHGVRSPSPTDDELSPPVEQSANQLPFKRAEIEYEHFFNEGTTPNGATNHKFSKVDGASGGGGGGGGGSSSNSVNSKLENEVLKSKVEVLGQVLKTRVQALRHVPCQRVELVFLVDSSASVGAENFFNELKFVRKLLADFTV